MTSNRLPVLQAEARAAHDDATRHSMAAAERALAAGAALAEAKSLCAHGQWLPWLAEAGIPKRSAQRYMKLAEAGLKSATVAHLGLAAAERYAANILDLRPKADGAGRWVYGEVGTRFFYVVTLWHGEGFYYGAFTGHNVDDGGAHVYFTKKPHYWHQVAEIHDIEVGMIAATQSRDLTREEALDAFGAIGVKVERHPWGVRLG